MTAPRKRREGSFKVKAIGEVDVEQRIKAIIELIQKMPPLKVDMGLFEKFAAKEFGPNWREEAHNAARFFRGEPMRKKRNGAPK